MTTKDIRMTQKETVKQYFLTHPNVELPTAEVVDWVKQEYEHVEGKNFSRRR